MIALAHRVEAIPNPNGTKPVTLSWPAHALSPNARCHWAVKSKAVKAYRREAWIEGLRAKWDKLDPAVGLIGLRVVFQPPSNRRYDMDNCVASIKSLLDGLADALGVDDARFQLSAAMGPKAPRGAVVVSLE